VAVDTGGDGARLRGDVVQAIECIPKYAVFIQFALRQQRKFKHAVDLKCRTGATEKQLFCLHQVIVEVLSELLWYILLFFRIAPIPFSMGGTASKKPDGFDVFIYLSRISFGDAELLSQKNEQMPV
jgi:hypothetical protein